MYGHILIPTDGYPLSTEALAHGLDLARAIGARVSILTVTEPFHLFSLEVEQLEDTRDSYQRHMKQHAARVLDEAAKAASSAGVSHEEIHVEDDAPYSAIIRTAADRGCDLIVMASHGRRGVSAIILGSETLKVLTHCSIPVLVCRSPEAEARLSQGNEGMPAQLGMT